MTTKHKGDSVRQKLTNLSGKMNAPYSNLATRARSYSCAHSAKK